MAKISNIRIGIDATQAKSGARQAKDALKGVGKEAERAGKQLHLFDNEVDTVAQSSKKAADDVEDLGGGLEDVTEAADDAKGMIKKLVGALVGMLIIHDIISTISEFETGLVGVGKTTNLAGAELNDLGDDIRTMAGRMSVGTDELLAIGQAAGQLGVKGPENILAFTDAIAKLGSASDLAGDEAAIALARMLNVTGEAASEVGTLAAVIVELGNNMAISESKIAHVATQVALSTAIFGTSSTEAAALGAAMGSMGLRAQLAGSAMGRTMRAIDKAIRQGGASMEALTKITGRTAEEIETTFRASAVGGVVMLMEGLKELSAVEADTTTALAALGLQGEEILKVLPTMALRVDDLKIALGLMSAEEVKGTAHTIEFETAENTLEKQTARLGNAYDNLKLTLKEYGGVLKWSASFAADVVNDMADMATSGKHASAAITTVSVALQALVVPAVFIGVTTLAGAFVSLGAGAKVAAAGTWILNAALIANPFVRVAAAIAALGTALFFMSGDAEEATEDIEKLDKAVEALANTAERLSKSKAQYSLGVEESDTRKQVAGLMSQKAALEALNIELKQTVDNRAALEAVGQYPEAIRPLDVLSKTTGTTVASSLIGGTVDTSAAALSELLLEGITPPEDAFISARGVWQNLTKEFYDAVSEDIQANAAKFEISIGVGPKRVKDALTGALVDMVSISPHKVGPAGIVEVIRSAVADIDAELASIDFEAPTFIPADEEDTKNVLRAKDALNEYVTSLTYAQSIMGETAEQQQLLTNIRKASLLVDDAQIKGGWLLKAMLAEQLKAIAAKKKALKEVSTEKAAIDSVEKHIFSLFAMNAVLKDSTKDAQIEAELMRVRDALVKAGVKNIDRLLIALRHELELKKELTETQRKKTAEDAKALALDKQRQTVREQATQRATEILNNTMNELVFIGRTNLERERAGKLMEYALTLHAAEAEGIDEKVESYEALITKLQEAQVWEGMARNMSSSFGSAFNDIILRGEDLGTALQGMAQSVGETVLDTLVTKPLEDALTESLSSALPKIFGDSVTTGSQQSATVLTQAGTAVKTSIIAGASEGGALLLSQAQAAAAVLAGTAVAGSFPAIDFPKTNAHGNAFAGGRIIPMANGQVVTGPTTFPMADGNTGLMGEAGFEAVMPLARTSGGDLGVKVAGGGTTQNTYVNMTVNAKDADSFRKSKYQIIQDLRRI